MSETRKSQSSNEGARRPLHPYLPTATARAVTPFVPIVGSCDWPIAVELVDYGIVTVIQITSLSMEPLAINDVMVNGEFRPAIIVGNLKELFLALDLPKQMSYGTTLHAVVQAPAAAAKALTCCYAKRPVAITVSTTQGYFCFAVSETIVQSE